MMWQGGYGVIDSGVHSGGASSIVVNPLTLFK